MFDFILMLICIMVSVVMSKENKRHNEEHTTMIINNEKSVDTEKVVSILQTRIIWVMNSNLEDKRERLVYLLRRMSDYTDTTEFLERNPGVFKYIFEVT